MLRAKTKPNEDLNGFMDEGTEFHGELRFSDTFRIDGKLVGKVVSENTLIVGETGQVEADIDCGVVSIRGTVSGRVHGRSRIELLAGSRVQATLIALHEACAKMLYNAGMCALPQPVAAK